MNKDLLKSLMMYAIKILHLIYDTGERIVQTNERTNKIFDSIRNVIMH